ncbi:MAG TPA: hypothetical protein VH599_16575 [Ktedonobacterales bacterium]
MGRDSRLLFRGDWPTLELPGLPIERPFAIGLEAFGGRTPPGRWPGSGPEFPPPGRGRSLLPRFGG